MKKKIVLATAGLLSVLVLGACSSSNSQEIATMKGGKLTVEDFYNEAKKEQTNQQLVRNMIIYDVFENAYGDKVTDKQIDKEYNKQAKQLGDSFESQLQSAGYTKSSYKEYLKQSLAFQEGIKSHIKLTDADKKAAWESFHPEVEARVILASSEDDANEIKKQLDDGGDFAKIAKEKSQDTATKEDGGKIKFDSQSETVPSEVKEAAFALKDGEVSAVVSAMDASTYQTAYYIVKMEKNTPKGNDMSKYEKEVNEIAENTKMADQTFTSEVIGEELKKANVKIKDEAFDNILADFLGTTDSTGTSGSKKSSDKKSESSTEESDQASSQSSTEESAQSSTEASN
ncbi:peptidylprolyl isomerase [Candidatus Enterococcus ferrettii]|uniref:Foldase protein PrsA n=1 Tax=Candidatus Enterococcus ferrettii TaxID=2815324 RepID=A0ABV0EZT8_9ENTE|nr:peptidylprolyl isomerase [Enterococcus sp. 665A]MBO1338744.1 peptidylprolyl isomerase [Enterococcus sp. 665A]